MRSKIILIVSGIALIIAALFLFWRFTHMPKPIVIRKRVAAKAAVKKEGLPQIQKKFSNPKVAIVVDDFGYNMNDLDKLFAAEEKVTFSILPNLPFSRRVAELASKKGYEVILHLPLESNDKTAPVEVGTIKTDMNEKDVNLLLEKDIASVPGLSGVSNHQGSKATEDKLLMTLILRKLKNRSLYFFDSLVTNRSVCREIANTIGVPYAKRDMFLDNANSQDYIEKQILILRRFAFRKGSAIAICHDRKNTIAVLNKLMPELSADGITFVSLSDMVK